ncbi:MAG: ABC transporter substrate-binding protein [Nitrososphaerota archaeon]
MGQQQEVKRRDFVKVAAGTVAGLAVGGIAGYLGAQAAAPAVGKAALSGEIPIGILHAAPIEVGPEAPAIEMAQEDINNFCKQVGIDVRFKFLSENAEESATKAVERAQTLIGQGVKIIVGSEWSSHCKAVLPLANERKVVLLSQSSSSPALSLPGDYLFRLQPDDTRQALAIRRMSIDLGLKAVIVVYAKEAYAEGLWKECEPMWRNSGIEIIESLGVDPEKKEFIGEFSTIDAKAKEALKKYSVNEVGLFLFGTYGPIIPMLTSLAKYPDLMKFRVFDSDSGGASGYIEYAGDICAQVRFTAYAFGPAVSPKYIDFSTRYKNKAGYEPYFTAVNIYDCLWIAALSILLAEKYDGEAIYNALPKVADMYFGVGGWTTLNENGDRKYPTYNLYQVVKENGKIDWKIIGFYDGVTDSITWSK